MFCACLLTSPNGHFRRGCFEDLLNVAPPNRRCSLSKQLDLLEGGFRDAVSEDKDRRTYPEETQAASGDLPDPLGHACPDVPIALKGGTFAPPGASPAPFFNRLRLPAPT